jgi:hypothetical protein
MEKGAGRAPLATSAADWLKFAATATALVDGQAATDGSARRSRASGPHGGASSGKSRRPR